MPSHSWKAKLIFRTVYRLSSAIIAVAVLVKAYLTTHKEVGDDKVAVIYNPVDLHSFNITRTVDPLVFRMVAVCRLDPIKNLGLLIRGFSEVAHHAPGSKPLELWIVGDGPSRKELESLSQELGVADKVTFWGFQSTPGRFLDGASLFILPSLSEGISIAVAEAMVGEIPCVVTGVGGGPEFIVDGENGWLIDPHDRERFVRLLGDVVGMPETERVAIGKRGKQTALNMFRPEKYMQLVWELYERFM